MIHSGAQAVAAAAVLFDVQRFSLHDGPGIRTTLFFKGCPLRCAWCQNPESQKGQPEIAFFGDRCVGCFQCREVCPEQAIVNGADHRVDYTRCNHCGRCADSCPGGALVMVGRLWDAENLALDVARDTDFFVESGGGVTLSGGEPMAQASFLVRLLPKLKARGIHINMETCGVFRWDVMAPLLPMLDLIYFDLKLMDSQRHRYYTGGDNRLIHANFTRLADGVGTVTPRIPLIPGISDTEENLRETARFLRRAGHSRVHCLPYHNWGEAKMARIQGARAPMNLDRAAGKDRETVAAIFSREGIDALVYD
jgi:pyruvate formate lyase activating enzyme